MSGPVCSDCKLGFGIPTDKRRNAVGPRVLPQFECDRQRIDIAPLPPCGFVTMPVQLAMMATAERYGEFVADFEAETPCSRKAHMVGIAGLPGTDQARLFGDKPKVVLIAMAARLGEGQHALVDPLPAGFRDLMSYPSQWGSLAPRGRQFGWSTIGRPNGVKDALKARIFAAANK